MMTHHTNIFSCLNDLVKPLNIPKEENFETIATNDLIKQSDQSVSYDELKSYFPLPKKCSPYYNSSYEILPDDLDCEMFNSHTKSNDFQRPNSFVNSVYETPNSIVNNAIYGALNNHINNNNHFNSSENDLKSDTSLSEILDNGCSDPLEINSIANDEIFISNHISEKSIQNDLLNNDIEIDILNKKMYLKYGVVELKEMNLLINDLMVENFFLENGGNLMEFEAWKGRPNPLLDCFLKSQKMKEFVYKEDFNDYNLEEAKEDDECEDNTEPDDYDTDEFGQNGELYKNMNINVQINNLQSQETFFQDTISDLAKQEAQVMKQINELRKKGLWSNKRLTRAAEPSKKKAHWDYLMEEMQWLSNDFTQERKIKKAGARKVAKLISRYFSDLQQRGLKAEKEDAQKLRRIAGNLGRMVRDFWSNIRKVVEYKQQSRIEEKRKKVLDLHLNFIVGQTEKYSTWLTEGLVINQMNNKNEVSSQDKEIDADVEIKKEDIVEKDLLIENSTQETFENSISLSDSPENDLLVEKPTSELNELIETKEEITEDVDSYVPSDEDDADDEMTLDEEEMQQEQDEINNVDEIKQLQVEGEMSIEELLKLYGGAQDNNNSQDFIEEQQRIEEPNSNTHIETKFKSKSGKGDKDEYEVEKANENSNLENENDLNSMAETALLIQPTGNTLKSAHVKTEVPFLLKHTMREYQHVGLEWLATMYERRLNGILADEMGLGKTIQTIALLAYLACEKGIWGPHLIIVPTSVILNWEIELKKWCPAFKLLTYYGSQKERKAKRTGWTKTNAFHVCITSYKLVIQDHQAFRRKKWKYFILDEAQNIKNFRSQRWQTLLNFHSQRRLLLTGTPLQNSLMELWSLMHFLMPHIFQSHGDFKEWFANPLTGMIEGNREYNEGLVKRLHKVLRPFLLRRLKNDVEKQMPKKYEHLVMCRLSKRQRFLYDDYMSQTKTKDTLSTGHYMSVINVLMQLRKVCNHPNLFDPRPIVSPFFMESVQCSLPHKVFAIRDKYNISDIVTQYFPLLLNELLFTTHSAESIKKHNSPKQLIVELNSQNEEIQSINCTELQDEIGDVSFRLIHPHLKIDLKTNSLKEQLILSRGKQILLNSKRCDIIGPLFGLDLHHWLKNNQPHPILDFLIQSDADKLKQMFETLTRFMFVTPAVTSPGVMLSNQHLYSSQSEKKFVSEFKTHIDSYVNSYHEIEIRQNLQFPELRLIQYDCGKLQTLDVLLHRLKKDDHRVLIFTQMTRMLDVLELFLNYHGHRYLRLDGSTKIEQRQVLMDRFNVDRRIFCFILSTRSGGIGVNLTGADTVIFYDSDWNPTMDAQAQDRCHRIGQTRDVHIYRLISEKTIEENILKKANEKRLLGNVAIEGGNFTTAFFKQQTIKDLFNEPSGLECLLTKDDAAALSGDDDQITATDVADDAKLGINLEENSSAIALTEEQMEQALCMAEEEMDIQAIKIAKAEQKLELIEFDESVSWEQNNISGTGENMGLIAEGVNIFEENIEASNVEIELAMIDKELSGIERYAVSYLENQLSYIGTSDDLLKNEDDVMLDKESWELNRLKAVKEAEEKLAEMEEDEILYASINYTPQAYTAPMVCSKDHKVPRNRGLKESKKVGKIKKQKANVQPLVEEQNGDLIETSIISDLNDSYNDGRSKRSATFKSRSKQKAMYYEDLMDYDFEEMIVNSDPKIKKRSNKRQVLQEEEVNNDVPQKKYKKSYMMNQEDTIVTDVVKRPRKIKKKQTINDDQDGITSLSMECTSSPQMASLQTSERVSSFEKYFQENSFQQSSSSTQRNIFQHLQNNYPTSIIPTKPSQFQITRLSGSLLNARPTYNSNASELAKNHIQLLQQHQQQQLQAQLQNQQFTLQQRQQLLNQQQIHLLMKQKQQTVNLNQIGTTSLRQATLQQASLLQNINLQQIRIQQARLQQQSSMQQQKITLQQLATLQQTNAQQATLQQINQDLARHVEVQQNQQSRQILQQSPIKQQNNNPIFVLQQGGSPRPVIRLPVIGQRGVIVSTSNSTTTVPILEKLALQLSNAQRTPVTLRLTPIDNLSIQTSKSTGSTHPTVTLKTLMQNSLGQNQFRLSLGNNNMPPLLHISNSNYNPVGSRSNYINQTTISSNFTSQLGISSIYNQSTSNSINTSQLGNNSTYNSQFGVSSNHNSQSGQILGPSLLDQSQGRILLSSIRLVPRSNQLIVGQATPQIRQVRVPQLNQEQIHIVKYL